MRLRKLERVKFKSHATIFGLQKVSFWDGMSTARHDQIFYDQEAGEVLFTPKDPKKNPELEVCPKSYVEQMTFKGTLEEWRDEIPSEHLMMLQPDKEGPAVRVKGRKSKSA